MAKKKTKEILDLIPEDEFTNMFRALNNAIMDMMMKSDELTPNSLLQLATAMKISKEAIFGRLQPAKKLEPQKQLNIIFSDMPSLAREGGNGNANGGTVQ